MTRHPTPDPSSGWRPARDRRRHTPGATCPACGEFVEERWATVVAGRIHYLCWAGHRWIDRRRASGGRRP